MEATLPRGRDLTTDKALTDVGAPRMSGELSFALPHVVPAGRAAFRVRWFGAVTADDRSSSEGEVNLLRRPAGVTAAGEIAANLFGSRVTFAVSNLFDHSYQEPMSFIPEAGRTFALSIRRDLEIPLGRH
jgi:hypothetical protein